MVRAGRAGPGYVLVAEEQSAGRGRLGREWVSAPRAGLQFSAVLTTAPSPWVPLLAGVAVVRAIRSVCGLAARLKWPNDVLLGGRKVAGLLAEVVPLADGPPRVVLGIGLNVTSTPAELPPDIPPAPSATSLALAGARSTDRITLLRAVLLELGGALSRVDYLALCDTVGRRVRLTLPDGSSIAGRADVDDEGRLVIDGTPYAAGDVQHVRAPT